MRLLGLLVLATLSLAQDLTPGANGPEAPAEPMAVVFRWDQYRSVAVVGEGVGLRRPAWIGTWDLANAGVGVPPQIRIVAGLFGYQVPTVQAPLAVAYRALAWRDGAGRLHLVARGAALAGPQADAWSPDSFVIDGDQVSSEDDQQTTQEGRVQEVIPATDPRYLDHLVHLQALCGDGI